MAYFNSFKNGKTPHFLWNAKMRFGKTFASYQLAKKMGWTKILVLTFKPNGTKCVGGLDNPYWFRRMAVHFSKWFNVRGSRSEKTDCLFWFVSGLFREKHQHRGIKTKNEWVHATNWDCVIFDEYHYGAWREHAKSCLRLKIKEVEFGEGEGIDCFDGDRHRITTNHYLYLSGTPFRAIASGEFIEGQCSNWTYSDEQRAKSEWENSKRE